MTEPNLRFNVDAPTVADDDALFESIAADYTRRIRLGERPTIDEYATLYPQFADMLRELLPTIAAMERAKAESGSGSTLRPNMAAQPERLGDFRVVRQIG